MSWLDWLTFQKNTNKHRQNLSRTHVTQEVQVDQTAGPLVGSGILAPWIIVKTRHFVWPTGLQGPMLHNAYPGSPPQLLTTNHYTKIIVFSERLSI